jgi:putative transposase
MMRLIDQIYTAHPYYGSPRITQQLKRDGMVVNHKRVERLMRIMGIQALYPRPKTSIPAPAHHIYPYLLKQVSMLHPNHVWGTDITFIPMLNGWLYLVAILDWYARYVVAWQLSSTLDSTFCITTLQRALHTAQPDIHNSDQGCQFTSDDYVAVLQHYPNIQISMDHRGRCFDNIFTERLWRTVKYEEVYLKEYTSFDDAEHSLQQYFHTYNYDRLHSALQYKTPAEVYFAS